MRVVLLSACFSEQQAAALTAEVDCVVGMDGTILDDTARAFAVGFYGGLGNQLSVDAAFRSGGAAMSLLGYTRDRAHLASAVGVDPTKLVLATH